MRARDTPDAGGIGRRTNPPTDPSELVLLNYRYCPVFDTVSMLRPESAPLPETSVRM